MPKNTATRPERIQMEKALIRSEERVTQLLKEKQAILESAPIGITLTKGRSLQWTNPAHQAMFGYAPERIPGMDTAELYVRCEDYEQVGRESMARIEQGLAYMTEVELKRNDGTRLWCLVQGRAMDPKDLSAGVIWMVTDVTERKRTEEALHQSEENFRNILENAPVGIFQSTVDRVVYSNPANAAMFGYKSAKEMLGRHPDTLYVQPEQRHELIRAAKASGKYTQREIQYRRKDGSAITVNMRMRVMLDPAGEIKLTEGIVEDITQRKRLEEQLRRAQKMEAIGHLAGGIAHDFSNIMAATLLNLGLLLQDAQLTNTMKASLKEVEAATMRASNLTRQLLLFGQAQTARVEPVNLNTLIKGLLKMLRRLLCENIQIEFRISPAPAWVNADAGMIEQVIVNLCINARDAMPKGGKLTLGATLVELEESAAKFHPEARAGHFVCMSVTDTGCGMNEGVLKRIFEPFFTTKEVGKGSGLGLASAHGIVQQHHGWIEVESEAGRGSSFRVYLPQGARPLKAPAIPRAGRIKGGSEAILLVEDEAGLRRMASLCLRRLGYTVFEAKDGLEALNAWEQHQEEIKLLFTDMVMPEHMTGLELANRLRNGKGSLKVLISSGYSTDLAQSVSQAGPEYACLAKPYEFAALAKMVRQCLDSA